MSSSDKSIEEVFATDPSNFSNQISVLGKFRDTPPAILADPDLPDYMTTNYDHFIEAALISRGKTPKSNFCRWNEDLVDYANDKEINSEIYKENTDYEPTSSNPLVYHLHSDIDYPVSMFLSEKDYTDFVRWTFSYFCSEPFC